MCVCVREREGEGEGGTRPRAERPGKNKPLNSVWEGPLYTLEDRCKAKAGGGFMR